MNVQPRFQTPVSVGPSVKAHAAKMSFAAPVAAPSVKFEGGLKKMWTAYRVQNSENKAVINGVAAGVTALAIAFTPLTLFGVGGAVMVGLAGNSFYNWNKSTAGK